MSLRGHKTLNVLLNSPPALCFQLPHALWLLHLTERRLQLLTDSPYCTQRETTSPSLTSTMPTYSVSLLDSLFFTHLDSYTFSKWLLFLYHNVEVIVAIPQTRMKTKGDRAFSVLAPTLWNKLPIRVSLGSLVLIVQPEFRKSSNLF